MVSRSNIHQRYRMSLPNICNYNCGTDKLNIKNLDVDSLDVTNLTHDTLTVSGQANLVGGISSPSLGYVVITDSQNGQTLGASPQYSASFVTPNITCTAILAVFHVSNTCSYSASGSARGVQYTLQLETSPGVFSDQGIYQLVKVATETSRQYLARAIPVGLTPSRTYRWKIEQVNGGVIGVSDVMHIVGTYLGVQY